MDFRHAWCKCYTCCNSSVTVGFPDCKQAASLCPCETHFSYRLSSVRYRCITTLGHSCTSEAGPQNAKNKNMLMGPLECIAGQKPLWAAISEIYETFSQIMSNEQFCTLPKCLPVRIQRLASATHSSPSPSIKTQASKE